MTDAGSIHIGQVNTGPGGAVGIGPHTRVSVVNAADPRVADAQRLLGELVELLLDEHHRVPERGRALEDAQELQREVQRPGVDPSRLRAVVERLRKSVGSATELVSGVDALSRAIANLASTVL